MNQSKKQLNDSFYQWIKEVQEADDNIKELEEKLKYYNMKLVGYNSPNFESVVVSKTNFYRDNKMFWLEKINEAKIKIKFYYDLQYLYRRFLLYLNAQEKILLEKLVYEGNSLKYVSEFLNISISRIYDIKSNIIKKFNNNIIPYINMKNN